MWIYKEESVESLLAEASPIVEFEESKEVPVQVLQQSISHNELQNQENLESMESNRSELSGISNNNIDEDNEATPRMMRNLNKVAKSG